MIRTFLAIRPSPEVLASVGEYQAELRETGADVRWVEPAAMHLTIHFLGGVPGAEIATIERALAQSYREQIPIDVECRRVGFFPNPKRPRVVWVGLDGAGLDALAERAETALSPLGFPPEERQFTPHLTLGRLRSLRGSEALVAACRGGGERSFGSSRIDRGLLYRSELRPAGSVYTVIATFPFLGGRSG